MQVNGGVINTLPSVLQASVGGGGESGKYSQERGRGGESCQRRDS